MRFYSLFRLPPCLMIGFLGTVCIMAGQQAGAQGCSDAGFCSIGGLSYQLPAPVQKLTHEIRWSLPIGRGDDQVTVVTPTLDYTLRQKAWSWQARVTTNYASGNLGQAFGLGDVYLSGTYTTTAKSQWTTAFTLGVKLPLNQSNLREGSLSLPMQYQSSLGTFDLIAGFSVSYRRWKWAVGWQQPLSGNNQNGFLPVYWMNKAAMNYPPSYSFRRKADVLLRSAYQLLNRSGVRMELGLLGIYHLSEDSYLDEPNNNRLVLLSGSQGLTLNATASFTYEWKNWSVGLVAAAPLVVRTIRPDGLTRSFVVAPQLGYRF